MRIKEFMELTGLSYKTSQWLYNNLFSKDNIHKRNEYCHRYYTMNDVEWVIKHKRDYFDTLYPGEKIAKIFPESEYYISTDGKIWNNKRGFLEEMITFTNFGYRIIHLWKNGVSKNYRVGRLVATIFIPNPNNKPVVNHIDGNKQNDHVSNLEWCTGSENAKHAFDNNLAHNDSGINDSQSNPVAMYSNDGIFIEAYGSMREASRKTGFTLGYIAAHVKRNKTYGTQGYYFNKITKDEYYNLKSND